MWSLLVPLTMTAAAPTAAAAATRPATPANGPIMRMGSLIVPFPPGYVDSTHKYNRPETFIFEAEKSAAPKRPLIAFEHMAHPGGSKGDFMMCLKIGGVSAKGLHGTLRSAHMTATPLGQSCQVHVVGPEGVMLSTELNVLDATSKSATETWLMVCTHAEGDRDAEKVCKATLASVKLAP